MVQFPASTGRAARFLDTNEPRLNDVVRRGKVDPPPPIVAGRRLWDRVHILQAAAALGRLTPELRARLENAEADHAS